MKKYYFFAALATVGLFASCSSDEDFSDASEARQNAAMIDDSQRAEIQIGVTNPEFTRGTGMVGGTATANNKWQGQTFNVFMFDKGTFIPTKDGANDIFNNAVLTTTPGSTAAAYEIAGEKQFFYFPATGAYSFFAYRIDDAGTGTKGAGVPEGVATAAASYTWAAYAGSDAATLSGDDDPTTETPGTVGAIYVNNMSGDKFECTAVAGDAATEVKVPFEIDGTQDLLIGVAQEATAKTKLMTAVNTLSDAEAEAKIYSAYAARRDVNPKLKFTHLLTRLYFSVIADVNSRDVSEAATPKTTDPNERTGFQVTSITVQSQSKGNIIAAYKSTSPNAAKYATASNRIEWTDATQKWSDPASLATFTLMQREKTVDEKAVYGFYERNVEAVSGTIPATYDFDGDPSTAAEGVQGAGNFDLADGDIVYTATDVDDKTGMPLAANKTTRGAAKAAGTTPIYYAFYKSGKHSDGETAWNKPTYTNDEDATANLVDLEEVTPKWTGYTPAVPAVDEVPYVKSDDVASTSAAYDALAAEKKRDNSTGDAASLVAWIKTLPVGNGYIYFDGTNYYSFNITTAYVAPVDAQPAVEGTPVDTPLGESMFVAPADENGYKVTINYTYSKKLTDASVTDAYGTADVYVKRTIDDGGAKVAASFNTGKSYKITIKLYKNGEISFDADTDLSELDGLEDDPEQGIDAVYDAE